jgi:hypothetical protein
MTISNLKRLGVLLLVAVTGMAGEKNVVALRNFCDTELKTAGFDLPRRTTLHIRALGAGAEKSWTYSSDDLFAYGWIINAATREVVWEMSADNTDISGGDRAFDGEVTLDRGSYEVYFTVPIFVHHTTFTHISTNVDHREKPLFRGGEGKDKKFLQFFKNWFSDDFISAWQKRCERWGIDVLAPDGQAQGIAMFTPPRELPRTLLKATHIGENALVRKGFSLDGAATLSVYALGERGNEGEMVDFGWIVDAGTRKRVWEMEEGNVTAAGGAEKNVMFHGQVRLPAGQYVLYYNSDDSHSTTDWNSLPPHDPLNWGVTLTATTDAEMQRFKEVPYQEFQNVVVALTKVGDSESRSQGFTLKRDARVRIYAIGERSNARRLMADYGFIMDARTRSKVWTMDVDRTSDAGGDSKNRFIDEVITLPAGSYIVSYVTDDSHAWGDWNANPPGDAENYGITVMTLDAPAGLVEKYVEQKDRNVIARIVKVGDDADRVERFNLDKTTRVRVYAIGEGQNREMYDYGWIEDVKSGNIVWEMTYAMTFHAGGHRKNRMVNTTIVLDKGEYKLHFVSDDSHSYGDWNVDPPEDQESWGITLYRDEGLPPAPPEPLNTVPPPMPPKPPKK